MSRRGRPAAVLLLVAAVFASCGDDSAGPDAVSAAGSWELWSLNGQAPPVSVDILTIHSGALDLRGNGSYAFALSGVVLEERWGATESGVWSQTGNAVSLNPNDGCTNPWSSPRNQTRRRACLRFGRSETVPSRRGINLAITKWGSAAVATLLTVAVIGCGAARETAPPSAPNPVSAVGVWELAEIDGSALPWLIPSGQVTSCEARAETLNLREDGSYTSEATTACSMLDGTWLSATASEGGTWLQAGTVVTLTPEEGYVSVRDGFTILEPCANVGTITAETIRIPTGCMSGAPPVFRHSGGSSGVASVYRRSGG